MSLTQQISDLSVRIAAELKTKAPQSNTFTKSEVNAAILAATPTWASLSSKPSTVSGFGITDAYTKLEVASLIANKTYALSVLTDVTLSSVATSDILKWNGTKWVNSTLSAAGIQPAGSYLTTNQLISVTGDVVGSGATSIVLTLANSGVAAGTYNNSATVNHPLTVDAKGRITGVGSAVTITPSWSSIVGRPTALSAFTNDVGYTTTSSEIAKGVGTSDPQIGTGGLWVVDGNGSGAGLFYCKYLANVQVLDTLNYTSYTPSSTGVGASGTWGISVTGNAASATNANYAASAPWSGITGKPTTLAGYGISNAVSSTLLGAANGVATLDGAGKILSAQLPSYVDDVLEYSLLSGFPATGETGKLYVDISTNKIYRWTGSVYIEISPTAGNADTATKLAIVRSISITGDATWTTSFDGSANATGVLTLSNSGVAGGTYNNSATAITPFTVDVKGRITGVGAAVTITPSWSSIVGRPTAVSAFSNDSGFITSSGTAANALQLTLGAGVFSTNAWAGVAGHPGYSFSGSNSRFGFSATAGSVDVYTDGNFYATDSAHLVLHAANYNSYAPTLTGGNASGTWGINITGNAGSASSVAWGNVSGRPTAVSSFSNDSGYITGSGAAYPRKSDGTQIVFNWNGQGGQPSWLWGGNDGVNMYVYNPANFSVNYATTAGNSNSISNAVGNAYDWSGRQHFLSNKGASTYLGSYSDYNLQTYSTDNGAAAISFHRGGAYAVNMGLDPDNVFRIGGWSAPANLFQMDMSGNLTMANNVSAYSDARLKKDLVKINGALDKVRQLTGFTYTRIDNGERQTGLLAQDVQKVLPEAVIENSDEMKTLSVAYGNLAGLLVESIKEVDDKLEAKIKKLEDVIASQQKIIDLLYKHVQASLDDGK